MSNVNSESAERGVQSPLLRRARVDKWARTHAPSDQWRQRLLRSCLERMKVARSTSIDERRKQRIQIVAEESSRLQRTDEVLIHCNPVQKNTMNVGSDAKVGEDQEDLLVLLEDLDHMMQKEQLEEQREENSAIEDILDSLVHEIDQDIAHLVSLHSSSNTVACNHDNYVLCPICNNAGLAVYNRQICCICGLRVDYTAEDGDILSIVRDRLAHLLMLHSMNCQHRLMFNVRENTPGCNSTVGTSQWPTSRTLWASCQNCRFEHLAF